MATSNTALVQGFVRCHDCGHLNNVAVRKCPLCNSRLHARKPDSLRRTVALIASAACLYIPANMFPIMTVTELGTGVPHTIIGGIIELMHSGMMPIALLVLVASILVPLLKLAGLTLLVSCVHLQWQVNPKLLTVIYRIIAFVGRWSMLDIFMISILIALVDNQGVAQVLAGPAATAFAAVVVLTMFAAKVFDPRLLWDYHRK